MNNVTIDDIKIIESELGIELTNEQRVTILKQYSRVVTDNAGDWADIIESLIKSVC